MSVQIVHEYHQQWHKCLSFPHITFLIDDGFLLADFRYLVGHKNVCFPGYFAFVVVVGGGAHAAAVAYVVAVIAAVVVFVAVDAAAIAVVVATVVADDDE